MYNVVCLLNHKTTAESQSMNEKTFVKSLQKHFIEVVSELRNLHETEKFSFSYCPLAISNKIQTQFVFF